MTRRRLAPAAAVAAACLSLTAAAFALPPFTTSQKSAASSGGQAVTYAVAVGCHSGFDRFVIRARSGTPGYRVRYVEQVYADGSGDLVKLRGTKRIMVVVRDARAHSASGGPLLPRALTPLCDNLRQVKLAGDFEGTVTFGMGLRRRTGFRVFRLTDPTRIVVDVAH